jgi:hypothetical protein
MATIYSSDLKLSIMATGENAGTWGQITNTNLYLIQQAIGGYQEVSIAGGAQTTALVMSDGALSNARNAVIKLTGTITGNQIVTVPTGVEKTWVVYNGTTGAFTVEFKQAGGTGVTFASTNKGFKYLYADATNVTEIVLASPPGGSDKQIQFNNNGSFGGITMGTPGQVLTTDGTTASFGDISGGAAWQAVTTSTTFTAVAGNGYFINTNSAAITATLPSSPTLGDFISFVDYAGTFDTNNFTVARNGKPIQGDASDLTVSIERAGFTLVFVDNTQGWLLQNK